jgi:hypothetical protein
MVDLSARAGRLREPRYFALYMAGCVAAAVLAAAVGRLAADIGIGWRTALAGGVFIGGVAVSAQVAHGTWRTEPRRAARRIVLGVVFGAVAFGCIGLMA